MSLMQWNQAFDVDEPTHDGDHQRIFSIINKLHASIALGRNQTITKGSFKELVDCTNSHFADEERQFIGYGHPAIAIHRAAHDKLRQQLCEISAQLASPVHQLGLDVPVFLKHWYISHILMMDKEFHKIYRTQGIGTISTPLRMNMTGMDPSEFMVLERDAANEDKYNDRYGVFI
jgi:hemerythrin